MTIRKVYVIHPEGNASNNPTLSSLFSLFREYGVQVVYAHESIRAQRNLIIDVETVFTGKFIAKLKRYIIFHLMSEWLLSLVIKFQSRKHTKGIDLIIGIDNQGIVEAYSLAKQMKVPLVYWSFEIVFKTEVPEQIKRLEIKACNKAALVFVQDSERGLALSQQNSISNQKLRYVPVGNYQTESQPTGTARLRDDLGIPSSARVAIVMGSIARWTCADEIIENALRWPRDWHLILHGRYGETDLEISQLKLDISKSSGKIHISNAVSESVQSMKYILAGINAGIAFYRSTYEGSSVGENIERIGLSSGKIATYLQHGVPVITNVKGECRELLRAYSAGFTLADPSEITSVLPLCNSDALQTNATLLFNSVFNFSNYRQKVWNEISSLVSHGAE